MSDLSVLEQLAPWVELPDPRQALAATDPVIYAAIEKERARQTAGIELIASETVSYTHLRAHETVLDLVCRLLLEKKTKKTIIITISPL